MDCIYLLFRCVPIQLLNFWNFTPINPVASYIKGVFLFIMHCTGYSKYALLVLMKQIEQQHYTMNAQICRQKLILTNKAHLGP